MTRAPGRVDSRPRGWPSSPVRGIEDQDSRRLARLPRGCAPRFVGLSSGFPVVLACRGPPVLVVERGRCERSSPAGHGWPAEWARKKAFKLCATLDVERIAKNPTDSRTIAALGRSSHPQMERRAGHPHDRAVARTRERYHHRGLPARRQHDQARSDRPHHPDRDCPRPIPTQRRRDRVPRPALIIRSETTTNPALSRGNQAHCR